MKMFRGGAFWHWKAKLIQHGWPNDAAAMMAGWIVEGSAVHLPPPSWASLHAYLKRYDTIPYESGLKESPDGEYVEYDELVPHAGLEPALPEGNAF